MSNSDTELFELCKEVYKLSDYDWTDVPQYFTQTGLTIVPDTNLDAITPLYTSDYLLEKLPKTIGKKPFHPEWLRLEPITDDQWAASYGDSGKNDEWSDTPLKALLKLVIALDDAGVEL